MSKSRLVRASLRLFVWIGLSSIAFAQAASFTRPDSAIDTAAPTATPDAAMSVLPDVPPFPTGRSTVVGGTIRTVDHVRDQLTLAIFGGRDLKVLFDERTLVFRDGKRISLRELRSGDRGSLETSLDGATVFARSIHLLSHAVDGESQGQVLNFDAGTGELTVRDALSSQPLKFRVPQGTAILRDGLEAPSSANLRPGALVKFSFQPGDGHGVITKLALLANPGEQFVFSGRVTFLDVSSGKLAIVDPRDQNRYDVSFNPRSTLLAGVQLGSDVTVDAMFDGRGYSASSVKVNSPAAR